MNDKFRWDPSLVKKFSSLNHFKLLNHLRNEVKKYPLNNKKNISSKTFNQNKILNSKINNLEENKSTKTKNITDEQHSNKSTVGFNNSKNFSIYNNNFDPINSQKHSISLDEKNITDDTSSSTFKDRLNQIDMK